MSEKYPMPPGIYVPKDQNWCVKFELNRYGYVTFTHKDGHLSGYPSNHAWELSMKEMGLRGELTYVFW